MAAPTGEWWDSAYTKRWAGQQVSAAAGNGVSSGYTVKRVWTGDDAANIYNDSLANGNDFRIVYWNGSAWVELDRDLVTFSASEIEVWFKLQADISGGASDDNYYPYYDNSEAGSPPANKSNVYRFWDAFDGDLSKWDTDNAIGTWAIEGAILSGTFNGADPLDRGILYTNDIIGLADILLEFLATWQSGEAGQELVGGLLRLVDSDNYYRYDIYGEKQIRLLKRISGNSSLLNSQDFNWDKAAEYAHHHKIIGTLLSYDVNGGSISDTDADHSAAGKIGLFAYQSHIHYDNVKARDIVSTEPTVSGGVEQEAPLLTLTADAILKKALMGSLTADAYLSRAFFTLTADAVIFKTHQSSIIADAILKKTLVGSLATGAVLKKTEADALDADAILFQTSSGSLAADGVLFKTISDAIPGDAYLTYGVFADGVILKTQQASLSADAIIFPTQHIFMKAGPIYIPVYPLT